MPLFIVSPLISYLLWNWFYQWHFCQPWYFLRFGLGSLHWDFPKVNRIELIGNEVIHMAGDKLWVAPEEEAENRRKRRKYTTPSGHILPWVCTEMEHNYWDGIACDLHTQPSEGPECVSPSTQNETEFSLRIFCECSLFFFYFTYFGGMLDLHCYTLVAAIRGYSLVIVVASLVAEHGLYAHRLQ